jgi:hypothetical protein
MQPLPAGQVRLTMVQHMLDTVRGQPVVLVEYETNTGVKHLTVSPEQARLLGLFEAFSCQQPIPLSDLRKLQAGASSSPE